jgi:hypothetical protein
MRFAVVGLYNSGSSALAGMLHQLGVNMGAPFSRDPTVQTPIRHFEPSDLSALLRTWWNEPDIAEHASQSERIARFTEWAEQHESGTAAPLGAKHPLLSLCGPDLRAAWGTQTLFIWSYRPLAESISRLERRGWFRGREACLQQRLWDALHEFEAGGATLVRVEWSRVCADAAGVARELTGLIGLAPSAAQLRAAAACVAPGGAARGSPA